MREELENKIMQDFPFFIARNVWTDKILDFATPCSCGDGWFDLIYGICKEINELYEIKGVNISEFRVLQIKEKWGELCFYTGNFIDGVSEIIHRYERLSGEICESCGSEGKMMSKGRWLRCLCKKCRARDGYVECEVF